MKLTSRGRAAAIVAAALVVILLAVLIWRLGPGRPADDGEIAVAQVYRDTEQLLDSEGLDELPQAQQDELRAELQDQLDRAVAAGAEVVVGGERKDNFFPTTVLTGITKDNDAYHEEFFGPVASVYKVGSEEEAVELANDTPFGLGSYVFTDDEEQADRVANGLDTGMVYVNGVGLDGPELPFGGVKRSGFGRELGPYGMDEFVNKKLISVLK